MPLSKARIEALLANKDSDGKSTKVPHAKDLNAAQAGAFIGNAGSVRRASNGATYRMPNGWRKYDDSEGVVPYYQA